MDLFGDDIDSLLETNELNQNIREGDISDDEGAEENAEKNEDNENGDDAPKPVEPKKRAVRRPQLRLNVERLKSDRGVHTIEDYFTDIKLLGKGYEKQDLNNVVKRLEHWAHRLYPNYNFDDFLATTEKLGKKKQIQTFMYRYRQGLLEMVPKTNTESNENEGGEDDDIERGIEPIDELDEIIDQQIQNYSVLPPKTPRHDKTFDSIRSSVVTTPKFMSRPPAEASTPVEDSFDLGIRPMAASPTRLNADQMAKIAENRRLAQERLKAKREALSNQQQSQQQQPLQTELSQIDEESMSDI